MQAMLQTIRLCIRILPRSLCVCVLSGVTFTLIFINKLRIPPLAKIELPQKGGTSYHQIIQVRVLAGRAVREREFLHRPLLLQKCTTFAVAQVATGSHFDFKKSFGSFLRSVTTN